MRTRLAVLVSLAAVAIAVSGCAVQGCGGTAVPDVKGKTPAQAEAALAAAGFTPGKVTWDAAAQGAAGAVVSQYPAASASADPGAVVNLTVAGAEPGTEPPVVTPPAPPVVTPPAVTQVKVPAVKTLKLAAAQAKITTAGLTWKHVLGSGDGMSDVGFVYKSSPVAGTLVDKGSTVTLYTWEGP